MLLSAHFTLEELILSQLAERRRIDNTPNEHVVGNLRHLAAGLEEVRALLGSPLLISSGYRCGALNQAVGGATRSQHVQGLAADFICPPAGRPEEICRRIAASAIAFDQLIYEYTWCHVSFGTPARRQALTLDRTSRGYLPGIAG